MFYMIMMLEEDHSDKPYDCVKEKVKQVLG